MELLPPELDVELFDVPPLLNHHKSCRPVDALKFEFSSSSVISSNMEEKEEEKKDNVISLAKYADYKDVRKSLGIIEETSKELSSLHQTP